MRDYNYPIYFLDNTCVNCGAKAVALINKFGYKENYNGALYPISKMVCSKCGREYFIRWKSSKKDNDLDFPIASSKNYIDRFIDNVKESNKQNLGNK